MAEIGRKGGEKVSQDRSHMAEIGKKGGENR
jgi:general stress protein YciG